LVQSVPTYAVSKLVTVIKSITAREIFRLCPEVKKQLWGGEFWSDGYFGSTVGRHGDEESIRSYVQTKAKNTQNYMMIDNSHSSDISPLGAGLFIFQLKRGVISSLVI